MWAAGGIILRDAADGPEVLLIHRRHHRDWSFPKGKLDPGESLGHAAEREVAEETGLRCSRGDRLPVVRYRDAADREKLVVYWTMKVLNGWFEPNDEVDAVGWFDLASAVAVLTYRRDIELLCMMARGGPPLRMPA